MAGHNKWSKVKNIKGAVDAKRSKIFTKITKEIMVASRIGGGNPDTNARLRLAVQSAREASMPKDNIERAIKKGTGELGGDAIEEVTYEGYGPGGVAILVETTSDNKNRTVADLRSLFKSGGGNMGESGSVSWMFDRVGQLVFEPNTFSEEKIMEVALEVGAQDVTAQSDGTIEVLTATTDLYKVRDAFDKAQMLPAASGFAYVPKTSVPVDKEKATQLLELLENLEDHDDVQKVHANFDIDDKILAELSSK
ncbi:YebC/PmpR family DNA-binding transcriptional regulator [bacterium]|nr:YebC/PmpR family DNA-binding transcriptional regulator [bacterium]NBW98716.1 YebC/PmpR family DNA-binding transcriptional regulator [bacterium]NBX82776.1 YebC/PmpR family DNA-binding transcriptional regulator [bacterium]